MYYLVRITRIFKDCTNPQGNWTSKYSYVKVFEDKIAFMLLELLLIIQTVEMS